MLQRLDKIAERLEAYVRITGRFFSWAALLLVFTIIVQVLLRYVFSRDLIALGELQWHFYAVMVMMSLAYSQIENAHVRVDVLHRYFSPRVKKIIEITGIVVFLMPLTAIVFWYGCRFTANSFRIGEISPSPGGMPWRWAIKAFIPIGSILLFVSSAARVIRLLAGSVVVTEEQQIAD
jgi:TRAP-type mannitol/chloroaromatic compound transport system permease small subunit